MKKMFGDKKMFGILLAAVLTFTGILPVFAAEGEGEPPAVPEKSLIMNIGYDGTDVVDKTGNANTVTKNHLAGVGGKLQTGVLSNSNHTPYFEMTQSGAYCIEVDSDAIRNLENMTIDVWLKNERIPEDITNQFTMRRNTLFSFARPTVTSGDPSIYSLKLNNGTTYGGMDAERGYGFYGELWDAEKVNIFRTRYGTKNSNMYDEWVHLVVVRELDEKRNSYSVRYYMDGKDVGTASYAASVDGENNRIYPFAGTDTVLRIGHDSYGSSPNDKWYGFVGKLSEFRAYNYAMTAEEIANQYNAEKPNYIENLSDEFQFTSVKPSKQDVFQDKTGTPYPEGGVVKATFTAPIHPVSVDEYSITLVDAAGNEIPGGVEVSLSELGYVAYLKYGMVEPDSQYYLKVNGLRSLNGVPLTMTGEALTFSTDADVPQTPEQNFLAVRPFDGSSLRITLNYPLADNDFSSADLSAEGFEIANAAYDAATRTITITAAQAFTEGKEYTVKYGEITRTFTAERRKALFLDPPVFKDQEGNVLTGSTVTGVTAINTETDIKTYGDKNFKLLLAVYDGGSLAGCAVAGEDNSDAEVKSDSSRVAESVRATVASLDAEKTYTTKLMLWDSLNKLVPYSMYTMR